MFKFLLDVLSILLQETEHSYHDADNYGDKDATIIDEEEAVKIKKTKFCRKVLKQLLVTNKYINK